ncbi:juvenile hormone acid O-methyltransferase-like isoform X4 [Dermacentor andersoni]|uniref:juvenile hormone acid O-methyltransferase-like isoform X4 n=1 Tax=Dermacentor andersoni TaxID=34620 RepID=UPI003B3B8CDC
MGSVSELANNSPHSIVEVESAEIYGASMGCYRESSAQVLDAFMNAFVPIDLSDSKLSALPFLDIGCGEGNFTRRYLLPRCQHECRKLVAVDHSTAMLEYARSHHMHDMIDYVLFDIVKDDVNKFLNEHGPFARVYSFNMLHWVKDRAQAMKNIEKMIAPGGECFVIFEHCIPMFEVFIALAESPRWKQYAQPVDNVKEEKKKRTERQGGQPVHNDLDKRNALFLRKCTRCESNCTSIHTAQQLKASALRQA